MASEDQTDVLAAMHEELVTIRKLLIFDLIRDGATQRDVAAALGIGQASVSRMFQQPTNSRGKKASKLGG